MKIPDIHLLQAAIMLADVGNYSRAARKLGIQQPTLTKRILELEHLIGIQLFVRSTQFVEPTDACRQFVEEAKQSIFHAERALHVVRLAERGAQTILHIGKSQYTDPHLMSVLASISLPLFPNLELSFSSMSTTDLEKEVLLGTLDVAIAIGDFDNPKITQLELMRSPFYIAVPELNAMAHSKELTLSQLHQKAWLLFERHVNPPLYDSILRAAGVEGGVFTVERSLRKRQVEVGLYPCSSASRVAGAAPCPASLSASIARRLWPGRLGANEQASLRGWR